MNRSTSTRVAIELVSPRGESIAFGGGSPLALIAGPCVIESEEHVHLMADAIGKIAGPFVFKASFDKANRTSATGFRGPGLQEGLRILAGLKSAGYAILTEIREHFSALPLKSDPAVVKFLRAALHDVSRDPTYSGLGRPSHWGRETLQKAPQIVQSSLTERGAPDLSFSSFVKHFCPLLTFPADVISVLEAGQVTLFEAELLARVIPGRLGIQDQKEARTKRAEILAAHLRSHGTGNSLRQRIGNTEELAAVKATLKSLSPDELMVAEVQREVDEFAEQVDQVDYTFLFVDSLTFIVQNMLRIDFSRLTDPDVDRLLAKLDDAMAVVREVAMNSNG